MWARAQTLPPHCEGSGSETMSRPTAMNVPPPGRVIVTPMSAVRQPALPTGTVSNMTGIQRQLVISRPEASVGVISKVLLKAVGSAKTLKPLLFATLTLSVLIHKKN